MISTKLSRAVTYVTLCDASHNGSSKPRQACSVLSQFCRGGQQRVPRRHWTPHDVSIVHCQLHIQIGLSRWLAAALCGWLRLAYFWLGAGG
jgi:hypothetical protein